VNADSAPDEFDLSALFRYRRALVVGCGASGIAAAELLAAAGVELRLYDRRAEVPGLDECPGLAGATTYFGAEQAPESAFEGLDLLVLSPGVPPGPWRARHRREVPEAEVHGELSLALSVLAGRTLPTILITGTNGKSTVTALTGALLEAGGLRPFVGGNLGVPLSRRLLEVARGEVELPGALVLECSSYQLETLRPAPEAPATSVAMVLNVSPDHLARYDSIDHYAETKARIFEGLGASSLALLSAADPYTERIQVRVPPVSECLLVDGEAPPQLVGYGQVLELREGERYLRSGVALVGRHNLVNALFALAAARHLGVGVQECTRALAEFEALPHRMRVIAEREGVLYIDDSKATNVAAVLAGVDGFERRLVLICGGRAKQGDSLEPLAAVLARQGRGVVALGESAAQFLTMAGQTVPTAHAADMREAVRLAADMAQPGDAVLLSPACASWDMYRSFVHRGEVFAEAVAALDEPDDAQAPP